MALQKDFSQLSADELIQLAQSRGIQIPTEITGAQPEAQVIDRITLPPLDQAVAPVRKVQPRDLLQMSAAQLRELAAARGISAPSAPPPAENPSLIRDTLLKGALAAIAARRNLEQGASLGFADELKAALGAPIVAARTGQTLGETFAQLRQGERDVTRALTEGFPVTSGGAELAGALALPGGAAKSAPFLVKSATQGLKGGLFGGAQSLGQAEGTAGEQLVESGVGAGIGGTLGLLSPTAAKIGGVTTRAVQRRLGKKLPTQAERLVADILEQEGVDSARVAERLAASKASGVPLTVSELAESPSLLGLQRAALEGGGPASKRLQEFDIVRKTQTIPDAIESVISDISPVSNPNIVGRNLQERAAGVVKKALKDRSRKATPFYQRAFTKTIPDDVFAGLLENDIYADALRKVRATPAFRQNLKEFPENSLKVVQLMKMNLDDQIKSAIRSGNANLGRILTKEKNDLLDIADAISPDFKTARKIFSDETTTVVKGITDGQVGILSKLNEKDFTGAGEKILKLDPVDLKSTFDLLRKTGDDNLPQQALRSMLSKQFDEVNNNRWGSFASKIMGSANRRKRLKIASANPEQFEQIKNLTDTITTAFRLTGGSPTAQKQKSIQLAEEALGAPGAIRALGKPLEIASVVTNWVDDKILSKNMDDLADFLISKEGRDFLLEVSKKKTTTPDRVNALAAAITAFERLRGPVELSTKPGFMTQEEEAQ